jgi:hypothetical protein
VGSPLWQTLAEHLARAEDDLTSLAGDRSLCAIARSGESFPAAKYAEGALSALTEVRRTIRRDTTSGDEVVVVVATVHTVLDRWDDRARGMADAGQDWVAYLRGGQDALMSLAEDLRDRPA